MQDRIRGVHGKVLPWELETTVVKVSSSGALVEEISRDAYGRHRHLTLWSNRDLCRRESIKLSARASGDAF
jgi:hypothetical protein